MTSESQIEWKCGQCGVWVGGGWTQHKHIKAVTSSVDAMVAARMAGELAPELGSSQVETYWRTFKEETRPARGC